MGRRTGTRSRDRDLVGPVGAAGIVGAAACDNDILYSDSDKVKVGLL
jgi:hypothetical protein